ncbi:MAG: GerMN domain-containing protein [Pyrinomonadaceae bacterium]
MKLFTLTAVLLFITSAAFSQSQQTTTIKLYFSNEKFNPNTDDCTKVYPVTRQVPKTKSVATAALQELFNGTNKDEEAKGYGSFSPTETAGILKSVDIRRGAAYVNFDKRVNDQLGSATSSCGGAQFFGMVEATLKQFPTIKKVYYAIERNTNDFYEWVQVGECPHGKHCAKSNFK